MVITNHTKIEVLCISYFDQIIGPSLFYCNTVLNDFDYPNLTKILEFNEEQGSFIFAFRKYQTVNSIFTINSDYARGGKELLMISYLIRAAYFKNEIVDVFRYLEGKKIILEEFATELKSLQELPYLLHEKDKKNLEGRLIDLGSNNFKSRFLELYKKYYEKLTVDGSIQHNNILKKIFIFGERHSGKTTFLRNVEAAQFYNQMNKDLPTMIYELVIDNLIMLSYDCMERNFECEKCKNYGGCLENAQGFIYIVKIEDKDSLVKAKKKLQLIIIKFNEMERNKTPVLIIGNQYKGKEVFDTDYVYSFLELGELEKCGLKIKYFPINIAKENRKIIEALRWLIHHII